MDNLLNIVTVISLFTSFFLAFFLLTVKTQHKLSNRLFAVNCEHSLIFSAEEEYGGSEDFRFDFTFNGLNYWDFENSLDESEKKEIDKFFYNIGHKIGGYAYFTQSDPRGHDQKSKDDVLLLQIDTDHEIMFGDSGVGNFFINNQDLANKNFEKAYFYWDCC